MQTDTLVDDSLNVLARTPRVLRQMLHGLPADLVNGREGPGTWSPVEVVGHLVHGERTDWIPRARIILARARGSFEPFDREYHLRAFAGVSLDALLSLFHDERRANLATLRAWHLTPEDLELEGMHPELGAVTLRALIATWVAHDYSHLAQVARVLAKQLTTDVGPWQQYLSVLHR
jgi:hypothetical protein